MEYLRIRGSPDIDRPNALPQNQNPDTILVSLRLLNHPGSKAMGIEPIRAALQSLGDMGSRVAPILGGSRNGSAMSALAVRARRFGALRPMHSAADQFPVAGCS